MIKCRYVCGRVCACVGACACVSVVCGVCGVRVHVHVHVVNLV